ncbi:alpha/beta-hydrolase [Diaporthe eres]|nr:alpha/beta-hydrolase [Diaporthe eres]
MSKQAQLNAFTRQEVSYKQLASHDFEASILVQNNVHQGTCPLIVRWHGGGLVNGHRLYTEWLPPYIITHAQQSQAIIVLPDYRLLPGVSSALDILKDVQDLFVWLFEGHFKTHLPTGLCADLDNVLVSGESAGGWLAIQSGFILGPSKIKAVIAQYPMIDMRDGHWSAKAKGKYLQGSPTVEQNVLENILSAGAERIVTNRIPPEGGELYIGLVQQGRYVNKREADIYQT